MIAKIIDQYKSSQAKFKNDNIDISLNEYLDSPHRGIPPTHNKATRNR